MDLETALMLIRPLADGVDPFTGEELPERDVHQRAQVVRALGVAVCVLEQEGLRVRRRKQLPAKAGLPWSDEDDERLERDFDEGQSLGELAKAHERSRSAVQARLIKLGKLPPDPGLRMRAS